MKAEHTDKKYEEDLKKLREDILYMGGLVEDQIQKAIKSLVDRESQLAEIIIERDHEVNRLDVDIDDLCIRLLALHQPAGRDLRFITTGLKITTDLERIGDMAVNICERALELNQEPQLKPYIDIPRMTQIAQGPGDLAKALDRPAQRLLGIPVAPSVRQSAPDPRSDPGRPLPAASGRPPPGAPGHPAPPLRPGRGQSCRGQSR